MSVDNNKPRENENANEKKIQINDKKELVLRTQAFREEKQTVPEWAGNNNVVDKIARVLEESEKDGGTGLALPAGITLDDIKRWIPKAVKSLSKTNPNERLDGRTGNEDWAPPTNFASLETNMGGGGGIDSMADTLDPSKGISIGEMIYREILIHGRETSTELVNNIGAIEPELLTLVLNAMIMEKYLKEYTEKDGLKTWELCTVLERNRSLGRPDDFGSGKPKELEEKGTTTKFEKPHMKSNSKDITSKTPLFMTVHVIDTAVELNKDGNVKTKQ